MYPRWCAKKYTHDVLVVPAFNVVPRVYLSGRKCRFTDATSFAGTCASYHELFLWTRLARFTRTSFERAPYAYIMSRRQRVSASARNAFREERIAGTSFSCGHGDRNRRFLVIYETKTKRKQFPSLKLRMCSGILTEIFTGRQRENKHCPNQRRRWSRGDFWFE